MFMKRKKSMIILLCVCLIGGAGLPAAGSFAKEASEHIAPLFTTRPVTKKETVPNERIHQPESVVLRTEAAGYEDEEVPVYQGTRVSLSPDSQDRYSMTPEQMEDYLKQGFSIADLYEADAIANEIYVEPSELLEIKKKEADWEQVKKTVNTNRAIRIIEKNFKTKYAKEYELLQKQNLEPAEQLMLFAYLDRDRTASMDELITRFKASPKDFEQSMSQLLSSSASKDLKSASERAGAHHPGMPAFNSLSEREQENILKLAERSKLSVEELAEKYKAFEGAR